MWRRSGVFKILSEVCGYGQVPKKPLVIYNFKHHRFGLVRFWPCVITQLWWGSCSNLPENEPSLRCVKLGTHQEETPVTQQILLKRFWMFGNWISLRDFPWEVVPQKLWILVQMELTLSRRLKSLKKNVRKPVWGNLISFAEILNYELCLWLTNILILLRFKILALSPNPASSKIFLSYKLGWILDMWLVPVHPTSLTVFIFCIALMKGHFTTFISALSEIQ